MNLKPFLVTIISAVCLTLGEKETGGEKGGNAECNGMCKEFISFIYDTIQQTTFLNGAVPAASMYQMLRRQASEFCKKNYENNNECPKLVKKTWMIVVSLESGANIAEICNEINTCHSKKSQPKKQTSIFEHALMFCAVWRGNQPDAMKSCTRFSTNIKSIASSLVSAAQNGNVMGDLAKCVPGRNNLGCYIQHAPPNVKLMVALLTSLMPSPSALTSKIQDSYFVKSGSLCSFASVNGSDGDLMTSDSAFTQETCRETCSIIGKRLLSSVLEKRGFSSDSVNNMASFCQLLNVTNGEQCNRMRVQLKKFHNGFVTQSVHQLCYSNVCSSKKFNAMKSQLLERCKKAASSIKQYESVDTGLMISGANIREVTGIVWLVENIVSFWTVVVMLYDFVM